jgi:hypothetical protein
MLEETIRKRAFESLSPSRKQISPAMTIMVRNHTTKRRGTVQSLSPFNDLVVKKKANLSDDGKIGKDSDSFNSQMSSSS